MGISGTVKSRVVYEVRTPEDFARVFESAFQNRDIDQMRALVAEKVVCYFSDGGEEERENVLTAFEKTWKRINSPISSISYGEIYYAEGLVAYTYNFSWGRLSSQEGKGTNLIKSQAGGDWRIVAASLKLPKD